MAQNTLRLPTGTAFIFVNRKEILDKTITMIIGSKAYQRWVRYKNSPSGKKHDEYNLRARERRKEKRHAGLPILQHGH